jgi:hypothetical protein
MNSRREQRRAQRFPIVASMVFRPRGETTWLAGSTLNISRAGVLFRTGSSRPSPGSEVEFVIALPVDGVTPPTEVWCTGHVVRRQGRDAGGSVAATIDHYVLEGHSTAPGAIGSTWHPDRRKARQRRVRSGG